MGRINKSLKLICVVKSTSISTRQLSVEPLRVTSLKRRGVTIQRLTFLTLIFVTKIEYRTILSKQYRPFYREPKQERLKYKKEVIFIEIKYIQKER